MVKVMQHARFNIFSISTDMTYSIVEGDMAYENESGERIDLHTPGNSIDLPIVGMDPMRYDRLRQAVQAVLAGETVEHEFSIGRRFYRVKSHTIRWYDCKANSSRLE